MTITLVGNNTRYKYVLIEKNPFTKRHGVNKFDERHSLKGKIIIKISVYLNFVKSIK